MGRKSIPVVDLFAGPGGLGEGFSSARDDIGNRMFDIRVSIEKDVIAHRTLTLRSLYRKLADGEVPDSYFDYIRGDITSSEFFSNRTVAAALKEATDEARCIELGNGLNDEVDDLIHRATVGREDWVLIGGPPCQAYSLAGRSRRRRVDPGFEDDPKHFLYKEYLRIIRKFQPAIFVMENVKGMLSSTHNGQGIFERIIKDLSKPATGLFYDIRSFVVPADKGSVAPGDFIIRAEDYGVPQLRHRVILLGIRSDRGGQSHGILQRRENRVSVRDALVGLPALRSRLSKEEDSLKAWHGALEEASALLKGWPSHERAVVQELMKEATVQASRLVSCGGTFIKKDLQVSRNLPPDLARWIHDPRLGGVCQHESRSHMRSDLHRYLFAAAFAKCNRYSPKLSGFPKDLLPNHRNAGGVAAPFDDRFRVQVYSSPSTTIVSHISKDGHYYIHPDPSQCRSFSVREAARIQTFPDNYFFEGNRTQQYHQVGNAVPPFLAKQLADIVASFLMQPDRVAYTNDAQPDLFTLA